MDKQRPQHGGSFSGVPTLLSAHRDYRGIWGLNHEESGCDADGGGACKNQLPDLGGPSSYLQGPSPHPRRRLCSPQNQVRDAL